ncbi:MAG: 50S ribosome-binding GTPase [Polyangiaceae bacterium]|jgi:GTP-binding protein Era|nr:50S ribosome-binding GTPase [Polyangiaceae bacterium]
MVDNPLTDDALEEIVSRARKKFAMKPKVAIAGFGKAGKSSLFNAIYGEQLARVSMKTDETTAVQTAERFGVDFTDTPGIGTGAFSFEKVLELAVLDAQHVVIHVLNGTAAISADDARLHDAIDRSTAKRLTVVNKADLLDARERSEVAHSIEEQLGLGPDDVLFISAKHGIHVARLVEKIADVLPEAMRDAFVAQQKATLALKERRVRALTLSKAGVCAAIAAAPIPVPDIFVITPIQLAMVTAIGYFHGVEVGRERALELMTTLGAGVGLREGARQLLRLVPGYGSAISAAVAFAGTVALGEAANLWFKSRMNMSQEQLRREFGRAAKRAHDEFAAYDARNARLQERVRELEAQCNAGTLSTDEFALAVAQLEAIAPGNDALAEPSAAETSEEGNGDGGC